MNMETIRKSLETDEEIKRLRGRLNRTVYFKNIYKKVRERRPNRDGYDYHLFVLEISNSKECDLIIIDAMHYIYKYLKDSVWQTDTDPYIYLDAYIGALFSQLLIKPIWDGFVNEEVNVANVKSYGCKVHKFKSEEEEYRFEVEYKIDSLIKLPNHSKWSGMQNKCRTFLKKGINVKSDYYYAHKKCLEENSKYIDTIYFTFYEPKQPYTLLYLDTYKKIDGAELNGFLVPTEEVIYITDNGQSKIAKVDYYDFQKVKCPHLF